MKGIVSIRSLGMFILLSCTVLVCACIVVLSLLRFNAFTSDLTERTKSLSNSLSEAALASSSAAETFFASELLFSASSVAASIFSRHVNLASTINRNARQLVNDHDIDLRTSEGLAHASRLVLRGVIRGADSGLIDGVMLSFRDPYTFGDDALIAISDMSFVTPSNTTAIKTAAVPSLTNNGLWLVPDLSAIGIVSRDPNAALAGMTDGLLDGYPSAPAAADASGAPQMFLGLARQSNWRYVPGTDCPFTSAAITLPTASGACPGRYTRSREMPCAGGPTGAKCLFDLELAHTQHSVRLSLSNGAAAVSVASRIYDQSVTRRGTSDTSSSTHGRGLGLAAEPGGNTFGDCTGGCPLPAGGSGGVVATKVFDDHLGIVVTDARIQPLVASAKLLALETTMRFRSGMSSDDVAFVTREGLNDELIRVFYVDTRDRVVFASHGYDHSAFRPIVTLSLLDDAVARDICSGIKSKTGIELAGMADLYNDGNSSAVSPTAPRSPQCGLPLVQGGARIASLITTVNVTMGGLTRVWHLRAMPVTLDDVACSTTDTECISAAWSIVAVPDAFVSYPTTSVRERVALTQSAGLDGMSSASSDAVQKTVLYVVIAAVVAALVATVLGVAFFLFLTAPVRRVAAMAAAVATMKYETINQTAAEQGIDLTGGAGRKLGGSKVAPADDTDVAGTHGDPNAQRDPLEDALTGTVEYFRNNVLPLREMSQLQLGFAQLVQTISSLMKYVPIEIALRYASSSDVAKLGMEPRETTVLFSDVVAFTILCEQRSPRDVLQVMSQYFGTMTDCVHSSGGTVDKFIGDVVMAAWGAATPCTHGPLSAVTCAVNMLGMVQINSDRWHHIRCRIGIHDGKAMVGNIGSPQRFNFTLIGDMVNVASRLKGANRTYGTNFLFSESLMKKAGPELERAFLIRPIGMMRLKGRMTGLLCYEVVGCKRLLSRYNKIPDSDRHGVETPPPSTPHGKGDTLGLFVDACAWKPDMVYEEVKHSTPPPELFKVGDFLNGATARDLCTEMERSVHEHHSAAVLSYVKGELHAAKASLEKLADITPQVELDVKAPYLTLLATVENLIENPPYEFDPCFQQTVK